MVVSGLEVLKAWIRDFGRNSKRRPPGKNHFWYLSEWFDITEVHGCLTQVKKILPMNLPKPESAISCLFLPAVEPHFSYTRVSTTVVMVKVHWKSWLSFVAMTSANQLHKMEIRKRELPIEKLEIVEKPKDNLCYLEHLCCWLILWLWDWSSNFVVSSLRWSSILHFHDI